MQKNNKFPFRLVTAALLIIALLKVMTLYACSNPAASPDANRYGGAVDTSKADSAAVAKTEAGSAAVAKTDAADGAAAPVTDGAAAPITEGAAMPGTSNMPTLIWLMGNPGLIPEDQELVEAELNKISAEKAGVKMKTVFYDDAGIKLALTSGEPWDIAFTCEWFNNYAVQAQAGYFADLTDKIKTVTPKLYATMPDVVWKGTEVQGKIFAVPTKKDYAAEMFFMFDKALFVDALGMDVPATMSFFDVEGWLKAAKDAYNAGNPAAAQAEFPLKLTDGGLAGFDSEYDMINREVMLGIPYSAVGTPDENKVVLVPESPDFLVRLQALRNWYLAGYINQDAATINDAGRYSAVKIGQGFYGADAIWSASSGYTVLTSRYNGPYLSTASIRGSLNGINVKSANVDLALKYLELVNTDQKYRDILRYGIEGTHWNRTPEGLVKKTQAGLDKYGVWAFSQGSYSLSSVEAADGVSVDPNMWNVVFDGYKDALATNTIGFSFDISKVEPQVAACSAVKQKYWIGLSCGALDPSETMPVFIRELETAGIRDIQAECQAQLDAFIAAKQ